MTEFPFAVVVPVKPPARGKSRLIGLPEEQRLALVEALVLDTLAAVVATPTVLGTVVATDDHRLASRIAAEFPGTVVIPDGVAGSLNGTLEQAAAEAVRRWPEARPAALLADLPCLTPVALAQALSLAVEKAPEAPSFVPDHSGQGTTLYTAPLERFRPRFGIESSRRHLEAGGVALAEAPAQVRIDVDDMADLGRALVLGVGPRTARASGRA